MKMTRKAKIILSTVRTFGAICLIALGIHSCILGFGWHHNMLAEINSEVAFVVVLLLAIGGPLTIIAGIYELAPVVFTAMEMALFGESREGHKKLRRLKKRYLW